MEDSALEQEYIVELHSLEGCLFSLQYREKTLATEWIAKLRTAESLEDKRIRNKIISHLRKHCQHGVFETEPFNSLPPPVDLVAFYKYLPKELLPTNGEQETITTEYLPLRELLNSLPDCGEFLRAQPVPRDGSFYIIIMDNN